VVSFPAICYGLRHSVAPPAACIVRRQVSYTKGKLSQSIVRNTELHYYASLTLVKLGRATRSYAERWSIPADTRAISISVAGRRDPQRTRALQRVYWLRILQARVDLEARKRLTASALEPLSS
jgi:hypothetical protein